MEWRPMPAAPRRAHLAAFAQSVFVPPHVYHFECIANIRKGYLIVRMNEYTNYQT
jgi:hypothetical protein